MLGLGLCEDAWTRTLLRLLAPMGLPPCIVDLGNVLGNPNPTLSPTGSTPAAENLFQGIRIPYIYRYREMSDILRNEWDIDFLVSIFYAIDSI